MNRRLISAITGLAFALTAANSAFSINLVMLTANNGSLTSSESTLRSLLQMAGYTVNTLWDGDTQTNYNTAFANNDCVYVPGDVSSTNISNKLRTAQIGVVNELPSLMDELGLCTAGGSTTSSSSISISTSGHYITSGFTTGFFSLGSSVYTISRVSGTTASGATVLATVGGINCVVAVDQGGTLANTINSNSTALGRRVQMPVQCGVVDTSTMTASALTMLQRIVLWAAGDEGQLEAYWKLNETSGPSASDSSGNSRTGTVTGTSTWATAVLNNGFTFNGSTKIQASGLMGNPRNISVAAWANLTTADTAGAEIVSLGDHFALRLDESGVTKAVFYNGTAYVELDLAQTFAGTGWHHFAATFDDPHDTFKLYVDGVLAASTTTTSSISYSGLGSNTVIGRHGNAGTTRDFTGTIDDVQIYSYVISATDVARLYGLMGRWPLNETSGTTANDTTIFGRDATLSGTAHWSSDCGGMGCFDFDGNSYFSVNSTTDFQPTGMLAITAWVKGDSWKAGADGDVNTIVRKGDATPNNYNLAISGGKVMFCLDASDTAGIASNTTLATGQWYFIAATWDGSTAKIYVNGVLDTSIARTGTIGTDTRTLYIGGRATTDCFDGMIRDVRIYNRQLTSSELVAGAGLVGYWAFSEGSGTTAADTSGRANTATLSGGATWTSDCTGNNNALLTNGTGGIAQTVAPFDPPSTGTVAFWMRSTGTPAATARIMGLGDNWEIRQDNDGLVVSDLGGDGSTNIGTVTPLTTVGTWYHFAATFDSTNNSYAIYVNGQLESSGTNPSTLSKQAAGVLSFGTRTGTTNYWSGALRDVRVYNRKLCPTEIEQLYGLNGYWKLDETSGSTAADSSGMGRNGTVTGTPVWSAGAMSNALTVNSTTYLTVPSLLDTPKNITLAAWGNLTGIDTNGAELVSLGNYIAIRLDEGGATKMFYYNGSGWTTVSASQTFLNKGWHHFAAVFNDDQNSAQLFIDGVQAASATATVSIPYTGLGTSFVVGRHGNGSTGWNMTGKVDDVRVYSRALCPSDILALKNAGHAFGGVKVVKWVEIQ
jgi:hypothetical protein